MPLNHVINIPLTLKFKYFIVLYLQAYLCFCTKSKPILRAGKYRVVLK